MGMRNSGRLPATARAICDLTYVPPAFSRMHRELPTLRLCSHPGLEGLPAKSSARSAPDLFLQKLSPPAQPRVRMVLTVALCPC